MCSEAAEKNLKDPSVISLKQIIQFPYNDESFDSFSVSGQDFMFLKAISTGILINFISYKNLDTFDWELLSSTAFGSMKSKLTTFYSTTNFLQNVKKFKTCSIVKYEVIFPFSFDHILTSCIPLSEAMQFDLNLRKVSTLEEFSHEELKSMLKKDQGDDFSMSDNFGKRTATVVAMDFKLPFPFRTPRV